MPQSQARSSRNVTILPRVGLCPRRYSQPKRHSGEFWKSWGPGGIQKQGLWERVSWPGSRLPTLPTGRCSHGLAEAPGAQQAVTDQDTAGLQTHHGAAGQGTACPGRAQRHAQLEPEESASMASRAGPWVSTTIIPSLLPGDRECVNTRDCETESLTLT